MEKLTPKQRQTINRITNALNDAQAPLTIKEISEREGLSETVVKNALKKMDVISSAGFYQLDNPTVEEVYQQCINADLTEKELKEQEAKKQAIRQMLGTLKKSASSILTQDNVGTQNPAYCVKERHRIFGVDKDNNHHGYDWVCGSEGDYLSEGDDMHKALTIIAERNGEDEIELNGDKYEKCFYRDEEITVTVCFTHDHAQDYIDANSHNLSDPFIYVESFNRNHEMLAIRQLLMLLAENPTMLDGALLNG